MSIMNVFARGGKSVPKPERKKQIIQLSKRGATFISYWQLSDEFAKVCKLGDFVIPVGKGKYKCESPIYLEEPNSYASSNYFCAPTFTLEKFYPKYNDYEAVVDIPVRSQSRSIGRDYYAKIPMGEIGRIKSVYYGMSLRIVYKDPEVLRKDATGYEIEPNKQFFSTFIGLTSSHEGNRYLDEFANGREDFDFMLACSSVSNDENEQNAIGFVIEKI